MNTRIFCSPLLLATAIVAANYSLAADDVSPPAITSVVLDKHRGTFTHQGEINENGRILLRINREEAADPAKITLVPASKLLALSPREALRLAASKLIPNVTKFGESEDFDFKFEEFWKQLVGKKVTLIVEREQQRIELEGRLGGQAKEGSLTGSLEQKAKTREQFSGTLLGFAKQGDVHTLKMLSGDNNELKEVRQAAIVSLAFEGVQIDFKQILKLLSDQTDYDSRVVAIVNASGKKIDDATITYEHTVSPWELRLDLPNADGNRNVQGWAKITNDTAYAWTDAEVVLKVGSEEYELKPVTLGPGQTGLFELKNKFTLNFETRIEVQAPADDVASNLSLTCVNKRVLTNVGNATIPAAKWLMPADGTAPARIVDTPDLPPPLAGRPTAYRIDLGDRKGVAVTYSRLKDVPIQPTEISGYVVKYLQGRKSTYEFKATDTTYAKVDLLVEPPQGPTDMTQKIVVPLRDGAPGGQVVTIHLLPTIARDAALLPALKGTNPWRLTLRERPNKPSPAEAQVLQTDALNDLVTFAWNFDNAAALRARLEGAGERRKAVEDALTKVKSLLKELRDLQNRRQDYASQAPSDYHGPIGRDFVNQIQRKEMELAFARQDLASAEYALDVFLQQKPNAPKATADQSIRDLGGFIEKEGSKVVTVSFGGGQPANQVQDRDLKALRSEIDLDLTLESLSLRGCENIHGTGLANVSGATRLRTLVLSGTSVDDHVMPLLRDLHSLSSLDLAGTRITDQGVEDVKNQLDQLMHLNLSRTRITDAALGPLGSLKNLRELRLDHTPVSDTGVVSLYGLTNLKVLNIEGTAITPEAARNLRMKLPDCEVQSEP